MADSEKKQDLAKERTDLAEDRTDWAEDRTILANERTFAGWMRTGLANVGIGLGFNALFNSLEPAWAPKAVATLFILIGIFVFWAAQQKSAAILTRLNAHRVEPVDSGNMKLIAASMSVASVSLIAVIWLFDFA